MYKKRSAAKERFAVVLLAAALIMSALAVTGCGAKKANDTPSGAVDGFLTAIKESDEEKLKEVYAGDSKGFADLDEKIIGQEGAAASGLSEEALEELKEKILGFDYEIGEEKIDGDKATVKVKIKTYDIGKIFEKWFNDYLEWAMKNFGSGLSEEKATKKAMELFEEVFKGAKKTYEQDVTLDVEKVDGKWKVSDLDGSEEFANAITGGMLESVKKLQDQMSAFTE